MRRKMVVIVSKVEIELPHAPENDVIVSKVKIELIPKMIVLYTLQKIQKYQEKREYIMF